MIQLGDIVKDTVTGFTGIAIGKREYLNGCVQFDVLPPIDKKTKEMKKNAWIDEQQLIVVKKSNKVSSFSSSLKSMKPNGDRFREHP